MVRPTSMDQIPAYLKAVTIMQPAGDIPAEVADHVRRIQPPFPQWLAWTIGAVLVTASGISLWGFLGMSPSVQQASESLNMAHSLHAAGEYRFAFDKTLEARTFFVQSPLNWIFQPRLSDTINAQHIDSALAWLENLRVKEGEQFSELVSRVLPTLDEAIATTTGERHADLLAYRGWADFLRSRDSREHFEPDTYYRQAIAIDPNNVYAHAMWGHWIAWNHGQHHDVRQHFNAALASSRQRAYVRRLQLASMKNFHEGQGDWETLRVTHEMWSLKEPIPEEALKQVRWIYTSACGRPSSNTGKLFGLSEPEHIALIRGLFSDTQSVGDQTYWTQPCIARLQEYAGLKTDALETYRTIQAGSKPTDQRWAFATEGIKRLSTTSSKPK
jgi:hypothetical protein